MVVDRELEGLVCATLAKRHGGHHHDGPETEEEKQARLDSARHHASAEAFWYMLIACVAVGFILRMARAWVARQRNAPGESFGREAGKKWTVASLLDSISSVHPSSWLPVSLRTLPLTKIAVIALYAAFVSILMTWKSIRHDDKYIERLGFRTAWVTTTQPTLVFLLAARTNPIGFILGASYDRLNWLHRWASRVFFASATIHGVLFFIKWVTIGFDEDETKLVLLWGAIAWVILLWTLVSSLIPFRRRRYEFFVFQHIASAVLLLIVLFLHVPEHHHFSVWCAFVAYVYDVVTRLANPLWRNIRLYLPAKVHGWVPRYAYSATAEMIDSDLTAVTIRNVAFKWTPGQHILVWTPEFKSESPHPFTIAGAADPGQATQDIQLLMKTKTGFTRRMNNWARRDVRQHSDLRLLVLGPYGSVPDWRQFESLVLIAGSTGGSFTTAVVDGLFASRKLGYLRKITCLLIIRRKSHASIYVQKLASAASIAKEVGVMLRIEIAVTGSESSRQGSLTTATENWTTNTGNGYSRVSKDEESVPLNDLTRLSTDSIGSLDSETSAAMLKEEMEADDGVASEGTIVQETSGRPDVDEFLRRETSGSMGKMMVSVCAGDAIERTVKRSVASLRTSPQTDGIDLSLHVERSNA